MIARPKMSQNEWKTTEIRASKVGNFSPFFSCPGGYGVGALAARSFPAGARAALLSTMGAADANTEAILLVAPDFVDDLSLGALLVPPKEYVVLASRLLLSGDVGFSSLRSLSSSRFMDLMTRWIDDLRALELELHAALRDRAAAPRSPWWRRICGASPSRSQARRCYAVGRPREAAPGLEAGGTAHFDGNAVALGETIGRGATGAVRRGVYKGLHDVAVRAGNG